VGARGRAVVRLNAHRPLRNQLAEQRRRGVFGREQAVGVVEGELEERVIA
jgi:hypothetical protein